MTSEEKKRYMRFSSSVEKCLVRLLMCLACLLLVSQLLLRIPVIRHAVTTVDKLEGQPLRMVWSEGEFCNEGYIVV